MDNNVNKDYYVLLGVMHAVDKWLDGDELKQDEVNRAATMREKTLRIIENLQADNAKLRAKLERMTAERDSYERSYLSVEKERNDIADRYWKTVADRDAAAEDMTLIAGAVISEQKCCICGHYVDGDGCQLDGTQFNDDGECHFTWHGLKGAER